MKFHSRETESTKETHLPTYQLPPLYELIYLYTVCFIFLYNSLYNNNYIERYCLGVFEESVGEENHLKLLTSAVELTQNSIIFLKIIYVFFVFLFFTDLLFCFQGMPRNHSRRFLLTLSSFLKYFLLDFSFSFLSIFFCLLYKRNFSNLMKKNLEIEHFKLSKRKLKILVLHVVRVTTNLSME